MKAIIDGKRYDTATAERIAGGGSDVGPSDYRWYSESLYRTRKGTWFLAGEGGPASPYAEPIEGGRGRIGGSGIKPLSPEEARAWLERERRLDVLEARFGSEIEDA